MLSIFWTAPAFGSEKSSYHMNKKSFLLGAFFSAIVFTAVGALSTQGSVDTLVEFHQRRSRDRNNQYMIGGFDERAWWYFQGRIEARTEDIVWLTGADPEAANAVQNF